MVPAVSSTSSRNRPRTPVVSLTAMRGRMLATRNAWCYALRSQPCATNSIDLVAYRATAGRKENGVDMEGRWRHPKLNPPPVEQLNRARSTPVGVGCRGLSGADFVWMGSEKINAPQPLLSLLHHSFLQLIQPCLTKQAHMLHNATIEMDGGLGEKGKKKKRYIER